MNGVPARLITALEGRYGIERELGAGGMATVYLAHDLKHERHVALKVLKPELAAVVGAERFLAEIRTTANLQHPHILPLFDSGEADGFLYFVMPYVEGESLRQRLDREKQLPVDEAVRVATEIADALGHAHAQGVIHRDIKPANILLRDGRVQVADFGIALAVQQAGGARLTETGLSVGTPHYMSPEQASGDRQLDGRSDLYSLGCVLYEMLAGEPPHTGPTAQAILSKILTEAPRPVTEFRHTVPVHVEAVIGRAIEKLPADRFASAAAFSAALADTAFRHGAVDVARGAAGSRTASRWFPWGLLAASLAALVLVWLGQSGQASGDVARLTFTLPPGQAVTSAPAISPDGRTLAFAAARATEPPHLYTRALDDFDVQEVPGSEGAQMPFFSPDGRTIAFFANGRLFQWNRAGGPPEPLADAPSPMGGTWGDDGSIVFVPAWNGGMYTLDPSTPTRAVHPLLVPDGKGAYAFVFPRFVPNRSEVLFTSWGDTAGLWRLDLTDPTSRTLLFNRANSGTATTAGQLLLARETELQPLLAMPARGGTGATATEVLSNVHQRTWSPDLWVSVSRNGHLAYVPSDMTQRSLVRVDSTGDATPVTTFRGVWGNISVSPDGRRIAADVNGYVWVFDADGGSVRLAPEGRDFNENSPVWDADGVRVIYGSNESGNWELYSRVPGAPASELILEKDDDQNPDAIAADGTIVFREAHPTTGDDLWLLAPDGTATPWQVTPAGESQADFSPDSRWLVYASNVSGRYEIYVGAVRGDGSRIPVTTEGGQAPIWSPRGDRIFYRRHAAMMAVNVTSLDPPAFGGHEILFDGGWTLPGTDESFLRGYTITPDGTQFIMVRHEPESIPDRINIVLNWFTELDRIVPVR